MPRHSLLSQHVQPLQQVSPEKRSLYLLSSMLFFWALFDGILGYLVPILVTSTGISKTGMGLIFGSSSIFGGTFDFLISKYFKHTNFRRIFLLMFAVCLIYPLVLWQAKEVWGFLLAMMLWGLYFDLQNFGNFDFIGTKIDNTHHSAYFGVLSVFKALAYLLAPLLAGLLLTSAIVGALPFIVAWIAIGIASVFFIFFLLSVKPTGERVLKKDLFTKFREISTWEKIGKILLPVLLLTVLFNVLDAFFWTIGPLFAESFTKLHPLNGLFLTAYLLPPLFTGWIVGRISGKFGKKRTAFLFFLLGSLTIFPLFIITNPYILIATIFVASVFFAISLPAINGAYADYISESKSLEKEIEGLEDFATNIGYTVGPMLAGFLADRVGNLQSFTVFAVFGICMSIGLLIFTPRKIKVIV